MEITGLAVIFQASPVFLPAIGLLISPFSTLPVMLAAMYSIYSGILSFICGGIILFFISPQEAIIFLFTTGLLGLILGITLKRSFLFSWFISSVALFIGIILMTYTIGMTAFTEFAEQFPIYITFIIFILFSFIYSGAWILAAKKILKRFI
ncbi:MAG: hypothetical protein K0S55_2174 [Clostridia bacterium]|nr:hypothetical protein [Clostridia bacterium]